MKSTGRFFFIPLIFAVLLILGVMLLLPTPERFAALLSEEPTAPPPEEPTAEPTAESAESPPPVTEAPVEEAPPEEETPPVTEAPPEETAETLASAAPVPEEDPLRAALSATATAALTEQLVLVVDHALSFWELEDGAWQRKLSAYCGYGKNGLAAAEARVEGSGTTPIGAFPLTLAFGTGENPGTEMLYRQITAESYWSAAEDESYNTWVESAAAIPGEHLADYYQYVYAVNIGFNLDPVVYGRGSAIFLHVKSRDSWVTAGCVSLAEEDMLALLRMLRDGAYIIIVPDMEALAEY